MTNWQRRLNLTEEFRAAREGEITPSELAGKVAAKLSRLKPFPDDLRHINEEREFVEMNFESLASDPSADLDDFDDVMSELYDWADLKIGGQFFDAKKVCWVRT